MKPYNCINIENFSINDIMEDMEFLFDMSEQEAIPSYKYDILVCKSNNNETILVNKPIGRNNEKSLEKIREIAFENKRANEKLKIVALIKCNGASIESVYTLNRISITDNHKNKKFKTYMCSAY